MKADSVNPVSVLTDFDMEVFQCIGSGLGTGSIADCLGLSLKTGGTYCINLRKK
jgi:DNA-binding CsgD family transcriptional regulator